MHSHNLFWISLAYGIGGALSCLRISRELFRSWIFSFFRASGQLLLLALTFNYLRSTPLFPIFFVFVAIMIGVSTHTLLDRNPMRYPRMSLDALNVLCLTLATIMIPAVFCGIPANERQSLTQTIPWIGILLGNALSGITIGISQWVQSISQAEALIEQKLAWGASTQDVIRPFSNHAIKSAMTPVLNSMAISGIVNIPGMMTGQLIAGSDPLVAAEAQICILILVSVAVFGGTSLFLHFSRNAFFTELHQLRKGVVQRK